MLSNIEKMQLLIDFKEKPVSVIFYKLTNGINYKKKYTNDELLLSFITMLENQVKQEAIFKKNISLKLAEIILYIGDVSPNILESTKDIIYEKSIQIYNRYQSFSSYEKESKLDSALHRLSKMVYISLSPPKEEPKPASPTILDKEEKTDNKQQKIIKKLSTKVENMNKNIEDLLEEKRKLKEELKVLNNEKKAREANLTVQEKEINKLKKELEYYAKNDLSKDQINKLIPFLIKFLKQPRTIMEIKIALAKHNFLVTDLNFLPIFYELQKCTNLKNTDLRNPNLYHVEKIKEQTNEVFHIDLPESVTSFDCLFITDEHISKIDDNLKNYLQQLEEYAYAHEIAMIFHLGDTFDITKEDAKSKYFVEHWLNVCQEYQDLFTRKEIMHYILGGNHDSNALNNFIDLLAFLENNALNIKSLGYINAQIIFNQENYISLHHPHGYILHGTNITDSSYIKKYLKDYYETMHISKEDSYLNLFGHFHCNMLNLKEGYCMLPSFKYGVCIKAYHLKIFFKKDLTIDSIHLIPLVYTNRFYQDGIIPYQKRIIKNL